MSDATERPGTSSPAAGDATASGERLARRMPAAATAPAAGKLGRFELITALGRGAFGEVWRA